MSGSVWLSNKPSKGDTRTFIAYEYIHTEEEEERDLKLIEVTVKVGN